MFIGCNQDITEDRIIYVYPPDASGVTNLDSNLFGNWKADYATLDNSPGAIFDYYSFSSNGLWAGYLQGNNSGPPTGNSPSGYWWVEQNKLFLNYSGESGVDIWDYNVSGNTLVKTNQNVTNTYIRQ